MKNDVVRTGYSKKVNSNPILTDRDGTSSNFKKSNEINKNIWLYTNLKILEIKNHSSLLCYGAPNFILCFV